jgi:hypothetical protein
MDMSSIPAAGAAAEPVRLRPIGICIDEPWASGQRKRYLASLDPAFGAAPAGHRFDQGAGHEG